MINQIKDWLRNDEVDVFLGYKMVDGHPLPHVYGKERIDDVDAFIVGTARYPLEKIATMIASTNPDIKIGMVARDCNRRTLNVLYVWNQLDPDRIKTLDVNCCPSPLKDHADCSYLEKEAAGPMKVDKGMDGNQDTASVEEIEPGARFDKWMYEFEKCIKCYGCRNICPVCFCKECSLEHSDLVGTGALPPEVPIFHLVRAVHMAGRCIDCGLCEDACPMDIPLRLLYRKVNDIVRNVFDYDTGASAEQSPFNVLGEGTPLEPKQLNAA
ncbi:MAG: 4Fe-4S binding protein [Deltaproteobacteria bacterium]|nr:4Fe-4S binding protein [Deltaproteobacteria bacterium]MBW1815790.1 4Fe-4S binding protein [Deltaproteobacteria bacterium]MBW2284368.1 4Fe-4S binding protein [Deltaproteobacteria bacterium]